MALEMFSKSLTFSVLFTRIPFGREDPRGTCPEGGSDYARCVSSDGHVDRWDNGCSEDGPTLGEELHGSIGGSALLYQTVM